MSTYKTFAIVGYGYTAAVFAKYFAEHKEDGLKWKILSRTVSNLGFFINYLANYAFTRYQSPNWKKPKLKGQKLSQSIMIPSLA